MQDHGMMRFHLAWNSYLYSDGLHWKNLYHGCQIRLTCNLWKRICQNARLWPGQHCVCQYCVCVSLCLHLCDRQRRHVIKEDNASGPELDAGRWRQTKRWCNRWKEVTENERPMGEAVCVATCPLRCLKNSKLSKWLRAKCSQCSVVGEVIPRVAFTPILLVIFNDKLKGAEIWWSNEFISAFLLTM